MNFSGIVPWFVTETLGDEVDTDCISPWEGDLAKQAGTEQGQKSLLK